MDLINLSTGFVEVDSDRTTALLKTLITIAVPAIIASMATYISAKKSSENAFRYNVELEERKMRHQVYSQMVGQKHLICQLYILYFISLIRSYYTSAMINYIKKLAENNSQKTANENLLRIIEENKRASVKSEELSIEVAKANEKLWETIGMISILFKSDELGKKINKIERFEIIFENFNKKIKEEFENTIPIRHEILNKKKLNITSDWPDQKEKELTRIIEKYEKHINNLHSILKNELDE